MDDDPLALQKVIARLIFRTPDEAAVSALNKINDEKYETGGVIYKNGQGYYSFSEPKGSEDVGHFMAEARIPKSATPAAIYHSHPGYGADEKMAENFSPDDIDVANKMKLLSYIRAMSSGNIKKFEPGKTKIESVGSGARRQNLASGDLIFSKVDK